MIGNRVLDCFLDRSEALDLVFAYYLQQCKLGTPRALGPLRTLQLSPRDQELVLLPFATVGRELHGLAFEGRYDCDAILRRPPPSALSEIESQS